MDLFVEDQKWQQKAAEERIEEYIIKMKTQELKERNRLSFCEI